LLDLPCFSALQSAACHYFSQHLRLIAPTIPPHPPPTRSYVSNWVKVGTSSFPGSLKTEFDGLTTTLKTKDVAVSIGQELEITVVVADVGDGGIDSAVFIPEGSLKISPVAVTTSNVTVGWTKHITWWVALPYLQALCVCCTSQSAVQLKFNPAHH
jgi:hypothetical protein